MLRIKAKADDLATAHRFGSVSSVLIRDPPGSGSACTTRPTQSTHAESRAASSLY
jgi:hypothetical protein